MEKNVTPEEVVRAVVEAATDRGLKITRVGRKELRAEVGKELIKKSAAGTEEQYLKGDKNINDAARALLDHAEKIGVFTIYSKVGYIVVHSTVANLRKEYEKTQVCSVWPFC